MISAVIITKNEEKNIRRCILSLDFCEEIVVVDDFSSDRTVEIAKELKVRVYKHRLSDNFSLQKNYGLEKAKGDWILFVDADEYVDDKLKNGIVKEVVSDSKFNGFWIKREDVFFGRALKHAIVNSPYYLRLVKKHKGKFRRRVHERLKVEGPLKKLKGKLVHVKDDSLSNQIASINFQSTLHAKALYNEGKRSSLVKIIFWPPVKFLKYYLLHGGFLDGTNGTLFLFLVSLHSFLGWSKLWLIQKKLS